MCKSEAYLLPGKTCWTFSARRKSSNEKNAFDELNIFYWFCFLMKSDLLVSNFKAKIILDVVKIEGGLNVQASDQRT